MPPQPRLRGLGAVLCAAAFALFAFAVPPLARAQPAITLLVHVSDASHRALTGAAVAAGTVTTVTGATGDASLALAPGLYRITVNASGYAPVERTDVAVLAGSQTRLDVVLAQAAQSGPREIAKVTVNGAAPAINQTIGATGAIASIDSTGVRGNASLMDYVYQVPGLHTFHAAKSSLNHFKIRGADNEPRTEIDGHPVSNLGGGNFPIGWLNAYAFDRIDVEKGPGITEGDEGRTAFGTIDMVTRGFSQQNDFDGVLGADSEYGSTVSLLARGALGPKKRLSYVLAYDYAGLPDPAHGTAGYFLGPVRTTSNAGAAGGLIAYSGLLSNGTGLRNEIAKIRYDFSPVTSLWLGYVGFQGVAAPLGGTYAGLEGAFTIAPCFNGTVAATSASQCGPASTYNAPGFSQLIGTTQNLYSGYTAGSETNTEPFFEGSFHTSIGGGSLTISPFTGVVSDLLAYTAPATPVVGIPASKYTQERFHGTTFTYVHPVPNGYVKLNYEYRSDQGLAYTGAPFAFATLTTPVTTIRENDISLTSYLTPTPKLSFGLGLFSSSSNYAAQMQDPAAIAGGTPPANAPFVPFTIAFSHLDPHVGVVYRATGDTTLRASAGSAIYGPGMTLVSGKAAFTAPAPSNNNQGLLTLVNPALKSETTVSYGAGLDQRLHDGGIVSFDLYNATIFNKFLAFTYQGGPVTTPSGTLNPLVTQTINASLQRNYGAELSLTRERTLGWGYDLAVSLNRAYFDRIPPSYFAYSNGPVSPFNGYQGTTNPYSTAHGELRYGIRDGGWVAFGADLVGADNVQRANGFTTYYAAFRQPVARSAALLFTAENVFNYQSAAGIVGTGPAGSGSSTITAYPQFGAAGGSLVYSQTLASVQQIPPRVFRVQLLVHAGPGN